ncbi:MAG: prephenate dehydrogenase/arogenate dehydrogenase family protein [Halobacteriales archaeon]
MDVLVVGGAGEMGGWFVDFYRDRGWSVDVSDPDADDSVSLERAGDYDVVVVAVPIDVTPEVIDDVAARMDDGLLMDVTSVKREPVEAMQAADDDVELLGTHPMYGPSVRSMRGQTVIVVPVRTGELADEVVDLFRDAGANVQVTSADEHDRMMAVVQGLTHYAYVSIGRALEHLEFDVGDSRRFMSPVYSIMLDFVGRILDQNPHLYADIQMHQPVEDVHRALVDSAEEVRSAVEEDDHGGFVELMREAARHYGDTRSAHRRSGKLIEASVREYHELHGSVGERRALRHIYSDVVHYGTVVDVDGTVVRLREGSDVVELRSENVELLSETETRRWREDNLERVERDVSVVYPGELDVDVVEEVAVDCHDDVVGAEVFDVYSGDAVADGHVSYGLRLEVLEEDVDRAVEAVERVLSGFGGEIRG